MIKIAIMLKPPGKARLPEQSYRAGGELRGIISDENAPPIHAQGQAVVVAEAFAARLCVLATRIGGIREVVENGVTGMLVQPQDSQALAGGIEKLLTDSELRQKLAKSGFLRARRNYHWEKIAADFEGLYRALIEKDANTRSHNTGA